MAAKTTLLVTGLSGLIGERFRQLFHNKYNFENLDLSEGIDITNKNSVKKAFQQSRAEVVIHLAAFTDVNKAHEQKDDKNGICYKVNVVGTNHVAQYCKQFDKYLIHISTDFVFNGEKTSSYVESDSPNPIEWYGQTKYWAEKEVERRAGDHIILRLAYPYQAKPIRPDFLQKMVDKLKNNSLPPAFTDHIITPTFVDDIIKVFDYCIQNRPQGIYHAVGSSSHSDYQLAQAIKSTFNLQSKIEKGSLKEYLKITNRPYQKTLKISNQKLYAEFGIKMSKFQEGLNQIKDQL